ncbi:MAG: adenylate/guanylate cyclase, partial [Spirulina sp. DLM2.Bin59]
VTFPEGVGFAGRVWGAGLPEWITTIHSDPDFGPQCLARQANLCTALGFPLQSGREMLGVMTFFRREQLPPDQNLLQMLAATGNQLGQFMKRKEAEIALQEEQVKTEELLLNILPQPIAERLKVDTTTIADSFEEVTVLFADLVGFTQLAATLPPIAIVEQLNVIFSQFDALTAQYSLEKIKTIGDAYMVVGGLPTPRGDHAEAIANLALAMQQVIQELNRDRCASAERTEPFALRIGINTGSVVAGVIGTSKFSYDLWGDTVNMASRMESQGLPGRIQVTPNTYHRLKDHYTLTPRGVIPIKGKGEMTTYWLDGYC